MGMVRMQLSYELLKDSLYLPEDTKIVRTQDFWPHDAPNTFTIYLAHPDFPEAPEGATVPRADATFRRVRFDTDEAPVKFEGWSLRE